MIAGRPTVPSGVGPLVLILLACVVAGLEIGWIGPAGRALGQAEGTLRQAQREAALRARSRASGTEQSDAGGATGLASILAGDAVEPDWIVYIHALASGRNLRAGETLYERHAHESIGVDEYRIRLPLSGGFDALNGFVLDLQSRLPLSAIDRLRIQPSRRPAGGLDAQFDLVQFGPGEPSPRGRPGG